MSRTIRCPLCRRETVWEENPWRPFCSERCQMVDLGRWAAEEYRIPISSDPEVGISEVAQTPNPDD